MILSNRSLRYRKNAKARRAAFRRRAQSQPDVLGREQQDDQSKKFPFVSAKVGAFAKKLFNRRNSLQDSPNVSPSKDTSLTSITREQAYAICREWTKNSVGRYYMVRQMDNIGWRPDKNWFLILNEESKICLMSCIPLSADYISLEEFSYSNSLKAMLKEMLMSLKDPYIYPVLDLDIFYSNGRQCVCVIVPAKFERSSTWGSLKDVIIQVNYIFKTLKIGHNCLLLQFLSVHLYKHSRVVGVLHGKKKMQPNIEVDCYCPRLRHMVAKFWKDYHIYANEVFYPMDTCIAAML